MEQAAMLSSGDACKGGCCPIKPDAAATGGATMARDSAMARDSTMACDSRMACDSSSGPLRWLPSGSQQVGATQPALQQAEQSPAKPSGIPLPAVVVGLGRTAQEVSGPASTQLSPKSGALVPVTKESGPTDASVCQVRRLPPIEDEERPTAAAPVLEAEIPTGYPSTGIE